MALAEARVVRKKSSKGRAKIRKRAMAKAVTTRQRTVQEMQKALGLDKIEPITLTPSDAADFRQKGDPFKEWYEQELRRVYRRKK